MLITNLNKCFLEKPLKNIDTVVDTSTLNLADLENAVCSKYGDCLDTTEIRLFNLNLIVNDSLSTKDRIRFEKCLDTLNLKFKPAEVFFKYAQINYKNIPTIDKLKDFGYESYFKLSEEWKKENGIGLWVVDENVSEVCLKGSCSRSKGFSLVGNTFTGNLVITRFSLRNPQILAHEMGHYFGLDHTFEENKYEKDIGVDCKNTGDRICDTPIDPGAMYQVFVDPYECQMIHNKYKPMVNNIMGYYQPCTKKSYQFTQGQTDRIKQFSLTIQ